MKVEISKCKYYRLKIMGYLVSEDVIATAPRERFTLYSSHVRSWLEGRLQAIGAYVDETSESIHQEHSRIQIEKANKLFGWTIIGTCARTDGSAWGLTVSYGDEVRNIWIDRTDDDDGPGTIRVTDAFAKKESDVQTLTPPWQQRGGWKRMKVKKTVFEALIAKEKDVPATTQHIINARKALDNYLDGSDPLGVMDAVRELEKA